MYEYVCIEKEKVRGWWNILHGSRVEDWVKLG